MRKAYLDNIRWSVGVCVVLYHVVYMYNGIGIPGVVGPLTAKQPQFIDLFMYAVYPWLMMILFLVSGVSARLALDRRTAGAFIRARTRRLLVPSTVGLFTFQFLQGIVNMKLSAAFGEMSAVPLPVLLLIVAVSGTGVLWYIQLLWLYSMLLIPVRRLDRDRLWTLGGRATPVMLVLTAIPVWLAAQVLNTPIIVVYRVGLYGFAFFFGYFVLSHDEVITRLKAWFPVLLAAALALCAVFCVTYFGENYADVPVNRSVLFTTYGWIASLAILGGAARYGDRSNAFTAWMGERSFGLYVFHYLGISTCGLLIGQQRTLPAAAVYLLTLAAGFLGGYLLNEVISRVPLLRWTVLGIGKER